MGDDPPGRPANGGFMAKQERIATKYPGVFMVASTSPATGEADFILYVRYKRGQTRIEERVGRTSERAPKPNEKKFWSAHLASLERGDRMRGKKLSNTEKRAEERAAKEAAAGRWTVARIFEAYKAAHPEQASLKTWTSLFTAHIEPAMGKKEPSELVTLDVERLRRTVARKKHPRTGKPLSDQTVKHVLALLKRLIKWAGDVGHIETVHHLRFRMPSVDNTVTETMTPEQARAYFEALDREKDRDAAAYFKVMLLTGIRKSALLALQWDDVDFRRGFVTLRGSSAKSGKTQQIPLAEEALEVLRDIKRTDSPYIWPGREGGQRADFQRMGRRLRDKAGLPKTFRPCHGLRHCFASWLASSGKVDLYVLQRLLTHGSAAMTARYAHLADDALKRAAAVAGGIMDVATTEEEKVLPLRK